MKHALRRILSLLLCLTLLMTFLCPALPVYADDTALPGEEDGLYNLSLMGTASATFYQTLSETCLPQYVADGNVNTRWSTYGTSKNAPHAIMIDLGRKCSISMLNMLWMNPARTFTYDVYVTDTPTINDGAFATDASPVLKGESGSGTDLTKLNYDTVRFDSAQEGRYVTLNITKAVDNAGGNTVIAMYELAVMGKPLELHGFDIVSFFAQAEIYADLGTTVDQLALPDRVPALLENGQTKYVSVGWSCDNYKPNQKGSYTFVGTVSIAADEWLTNTKGLKVTKTIILGDLPAEGRLEQSLADGWLFYKGSLTGAEKVDADVSSFTGTSLPHTWNAEDGADGNNDYYRGDAWYRRELYGRESYDGKRVYLYFEGVSRECVVYLNGTQVGAHRGAYTAFYIDITDHIRSGSNVLAIKVNNEIKEDLATLTGDFTQWGGIYRDAYLVVTGEQHIDTSDLGSNGLYMTTTNVSAESATITVKSTVYNDANTSKTLTLYYDLSIPADGAVEWIDELPTSWLPFDPADMTVPGGQVVHQTEKTVTVAAGESYTFEYTFTLSDPHLWNGLKDPFRYIGTLEVECNGVVTDAVSDYIGLRSFTIDANTGAYLNGSSYNLRGVSRHQDRAGMGSAITVKEHNEDFAMIYEMGANAIRLAHYPQADYFYDLCDQYGMLVWAENAFVNYVGGEGTYENPDETRAIFMDSVRTQLKELIRQQYNHPSIIVWCIQNEVQPENAEFMIPFCRELTELCHTEDPTRLVTQATANGSNSHWPSDLICTNLYPGWYYSHYTELKSYIDNFRANADGRPVGISEYGLGANYEHHCEGYPAVECKSDIPFQYEEYQAEGHESYIAQINQMDYLWCTFVWNMFDFGVDHRYEAQVHGLNNKGLVSYDRTIRKDAFYLYKANWSDLPTLHIGSSRMTYRLADTIAVKTYSNCDSVSLFVNGTLIGTKSQADLAQETVFLWENVELQSGKNTVRVVGTLNGEEYTDEVTWYYVALSSDIYTIDNELRNLIIPDEGACIEDIVSDLLCNTDAAMTVYAADGVTVLTEGTVTEGMTLKLKDENGEVVYTFIRENIAAGGEAEATYSQKGNQPTSVNDGSLITYWSSYGSTSLPQGIQIDLGSIQTVAELKLMFYGEGRTYTYDLYITDEPVLTSLPDTATMKNLTGRGYGAAGGLPEDAAYESVLLPEGTEGQYVTIMVKACSPAVTTAAIWEIEAYRSLYGSKEHDPTLENPGDTPGDEDDPPANPPSTGDDENDPPATTQPGSGCKSALTGSAMLIAALALGAIFIRKKETE